MLRLQCATCKFTHQHAIKARPKTQRPRRALNAVVAPWLTRSPVRPQRCKHFEIGGDKKGKGATLF